MVQELELADRLSPSNWANYCDRASALMRLGYYGQSPEWFQKAIELLDIVVNRLRPGYGFAVYEMGRVHRLGGDFKRAAAAFDRVLAIPPEDRDISDRRPTLELARARQGDMSFP